MAFFLIFVVFVLGAITLIFTLGRARYFFSEKILRILAEMILGLHGIKLKVHHRPDVFSSEQLIFISNHSTSLDMLVILALGLPRTRFFLSKKTIPIFPVTALAVLARVFYLDTQDFPVQRERQFAQACRELKKSGESAFLTPEGTRITTGEFGKFNKGAFHLAAELKCSIQPLYLSIPRNINRGRSWGVQPGTVEVCFLPLISPPALSHVRGPERKPYLEKYAREVREKYEQHT